MRLRTDLQREHERKLAEMREASQRLKDDCDHKVELANKKSLDLEDYISRLKKQVCDNNVVLLYGEFVLYNAESLSLMHAVLY